MDGQDGAVEANADVRITNLTASERTGSTVRVVTDATASGSFSRSILAELGDQIEIVAIDAAGNESPATTISAGPAITSLNLRVVGDEPQTGVSGQALVDPLQVQVTAPPPHGEIRGVAVLFEVRSGGGVLSRSRAITTAAGIATTDLTLGPEGTHEVVARLELDPANEIVLEAESVGAPRIDQVTPAEAEPGETIEIRGANFSPIARHNDVRFGNEAAEVSEASPTRLVVEVPLFALDGAITVSLTGVSSNAQAFEVLPVPVDAPAVGSADLDVLAGGDGEIVLPFEDASTEYLLVVQATSPTPNTFSTTFSASGGATLSASSPAGGLTPAAARRSRIEGESRIREMERDALRQLPATVRNDPPRGGLQPAQELGSQRDFFVVNSAGPIAIGDRDNFDQVTATLRYRGENTLVYVDDRVSGTSITDAMLNSLGNRFDDQIYPRDVGAFGEPSDEDGNGRVIILLSPTVNSLTTQEIFEQGSRVVGFFFGIDLLFDPVSNPFANDAEVFYSVVPDPNATFGAAPTETGSDYVDLVAGVTAHEFQHMISFNWHVCRNQTPCQQRGQQEALWLDEGLSHQAEAINDQHFQNQLRAALFLATPQSTSLVGGGNELDERGASYLFVQYLVDRFGEGILRDMVVDAGLAGRSGIVNVDVATDVAFTFLFHQWASTLFLDGQGLTADPVFDLPSRNLRSDFAFGKEVLNSNPETPDRITTEYLDLVTRDILEVRETDLTITQHGTSPAYVRVTSPGRVNAPVTVDGAIGSELQVTVIRTK